MYLAKQTHSGYQIYNKNLGQEANDHLALQNGLRNAIAHGELVLHFQPRIDFSSGYINGVEALVHWQHPKLGLLAPDQFIPMAEQTGLIKPLTYHVLRSALRQCQEWQRNGMDLSMSVNISAVNIRDPEFPGQVAKILQEFTVLPARLELDVAETVLLSDPARAVDCIRQLSALGLQIAIDDFGTGYTSMTYLKEMLVAKIKIDKSFVTNMAESHSDAMIVRTTVELGHNLGLKGVAEGVESQVVWGKLKALGCDDAQGYHMGRPMPADGFAEWLSQSPWGLKPNT
jgi:EAL domain-containing protein (putative c-di-GMP-specific phosphodiesterase class I)